MSDAFGEALNNIERSRRDLLSELLKAYKEELCAFDNKKCLVCGSVQGVPFNGFKKYYCGHIALSARKLARLRFNMRELEVMDYVSFVLKSGDGGGQ